MAPTEVLLGSAMATHGKLMTALEKSRETVPRYLFRACSAQSGGGMKGLNSATAIKPHAFVDGAGHQHISDIKYETLKEMIDLHFTTQVSKKGSPHRSEFSSWASSVALALHYAYCQLKWLERTDVYFCVLDTYDEILKSKVNAYYGPDLHAAGLSSRPYVHEYLVHGIVEGKTFKAVSCDTLVDMGLYGPRGIPEILKGIAGNDDGHNGDTWWAQKSKARWELRPMIPMYKEHIEYLRRIAETFGPRFELIMTFAFATVARRRLYRGRANWDWELRTQYSQHALKAFDEAVGDLRWESEKHEEYGISEEADNKLLWKSAICGPRCLRSDNDYHTNGFQMVEQMYKLMYDLMKYRYQQLYGPKWIKGKVNASLQKQAAKNLSKHKAEKRKDMGCLRKPKTDVISRDIIAKKQDHRDYMPLSLTDLGRKRSCVIINSRNLESSWAHDDYSGVLSSVIL